MPYKVLLVDDHDIVRAGLKRILEESNEVLVVAEAKDGMEAVRQFELTKPDLVVIDISMPGMDGLSTVRHLTSIHPDARMLVLTMHLEEHYAVRALRAGALGYMTKDCSPSDLLDAIRKVADGKTFISEDQRDAVLLQLVGRQACSDEMHMLSDRELQILCSIARGKGVTDIAREVGLSSRTIETYRRNILQKLSLEGNAGICRYAFERHLL